MVTRMLERKAGFAAVLIVLAIAAALLPELAMEFQAAGEPAETAHAYPRPIAMPDQGQAGTEPADSVAATVLEFLGDGSETALNGFEGEGWFQELIYVLGEPYRR